MSTGFSDQPLGQAPQELQEYRSISGSAILALLLGIVSVSALSHPAAWLIPVAAVLCALVAQFRIARQPDVLQGKALAAIGLVLGLFFGVWAVSSYVSATWLLRQQACSFAEQWLESVLEGKLEHAHQATLEYYHRQPDGTLLEEYYQNHPDELNAMQEFFSDGILKDVLDLKGQAQIRFDEIIGILKEPDANYLSLRYFVVPNDPQLAELHVQLELLRLVRDDGVYWSVLDAEDVSLYQRPSSNFVQ